MNSLRGLDILQELVDDSSISEIMVNSPKDIFVEKNGIVFKTDLAFESSERLHNIIQQIVSYSNRRVNEMTPITDARLMLDFPNFSRTAYIESSISSSFAFSSV